MKIHSSKMSHNACYGKLFTCFGKHVYGFNVSVGDVVYMTDLEKYGIVVSVDCSNSLRPCFYVECRMASGKVCQFPFTDIDCKYCVIPALDTVVRLDNGVARIGSVVFDTKFSGVGYPFVISKIYTSERRCFIVPVKAQARPFGHWCPVSDLVLKV